MRHVAVRRLAVLLGAVFLLWAGVFAWIVRREPAAEPPPVSPQVVSSATLFERYCASCHTVEAMRAAVAAGSAGSRRAELEQFLEGHGDATADEDRQIVDYLWGQTP
jgi:mono/diheme cytochrome c family protein